MSMVSTGVIVVGAGVIGASVAYHLAAEGVAVTIVDAGLPAHGATAHSFAWISGGATTAGRAVALRRRASAEYRRLADAIPLLPLRWTGALLRGEFAADAVHPAASAEHEPALRDTSTNSWWRGDDGAADPIALTDALIAAALARGAQLHIGEPVIDLLRDDRRIVGVRTPGTDLRASTVVLCAGVGNIALTSLVGYRLQAHASPAVLARVRTSPGVVAGLYAGDDVEAHESEPGIVVVPLDYAGERSSNDLQAAAQRAAADLAGAFASGDSPTALFATIGWRPMPDDGEPIIGPVPGAAGAYVVMAHSGVSLAAVIGRLVTAEVVDGPVSDLEPLRPRVQR